MPLFPFFFGLEPGAQNNQPEIQTNEQNDHWYCNSGSLSAKYPSIPDGHTYTIGQRVWPFTHVTITGSAELRLRLTGDGNGENNVKWQFWFGFRLNVGRIQYFHGGHTYICGHRIKLMPSFLVLPNFNSELWAKYQCIHDGHRVWSLTIATSSSVAELTMGPTWANRIMREDSK